MAVIHFSSELMERTGGLRAVDIPAPRVRDLMDALVLRYPALKDAVEQMAVAVDGEIYQEADYVPLAPKSQVHLVPRIVGG